jgi:predicted enzyme related to lactoylglutathione lyase
MSNTIGHVEVLSDGDPAPLRDFYGSVFGWEIGPVDASDPEQMEYAMVRIEEGDGAITAGIGRKTPAQLPITFYVRVDDLRASLDAIAARGGRTVTPPLQVGPATIIARFADPAGNVVGLMSDVA